MIARLRDPISGLTHFIGCVLAILGLVLLLVKVADPIKPLHMATFSIFCVGMILLYLASTLYHWLPLSEAGILLLKRVDHIMIFVMIAASYTPICLVSLRESVGWELFFGVWSIAFVGLLVKVFWITAPRWLSVSLYVLMGWLALLGIVPIVKALPSGAVFWLITGGVSYTLGAVIYAIKKPNPWPDQFGFHEIFHLFVMLGSFSHYLMMYQYIALMN